MADTSPTFAVRSIPVTPVGVSGAMTQQLIPPIDCSKIVIRNSDATNLLFIRSDPADASTQETIPAAAEFTIQMAPMTGTAPPMMKTVPVAYLAGQAPGQSPAIVKFFR